MSRAPKALPHPIIEAAAAGELPEWAEAGPERRAHMDRVAALMGRWAESLGLDAGDRARFMAAGRLHDALRDADPESLRPLLDPWMAGIAAKLVHGPAAAAKLRRAGVEDEALLRAVAWHTLGHPDLDELGRCLYLADYLEPGRDYHDESLARMADRVPEDLRGVLREVAAVRIARLLDDGRPLMPETVEFWNGATED